MLKLSDKVFPKASNDLKRSLPIILLFNFGLSYIIREILRKGDSMDKNKYLKELKKRLSILEEQEVQRIEAEYIRFFEEKLEQGLTEETIINELGSVNDLARKLLQMYKISPRYIKLFVGKEKVIDDLNEFTNKITDTTIQVFDKVEQSVKRAFKKTVEAGGKGFQSVKNIFKRKESGEDEQANVVPVDDSDVELNE